jgi:capsular polysaccharide biosynthesis protein
LENTELIEIEYISKDKDNAKYITARIVENICSYPPLTQSYKATVSVAESATEPKVSNNNLMLFSVIGFILGMVIAFIIAVLRDMLDTRVKTVNDIKVRYNLPVLGAIPTLKGKKI